jgi:hypothetical protein
MNETISGTLFIGSGVTPDIALSETSGVATSFNINHQNIDFSILGTGINSLVYFDASAGRLGIGTGLPDAVLHVVAPCAKDGLIIESVTNCPTGVTLLLVHNPQTAPQSGSYPAIINLAGRDTNYEEIAYGQIMSRVLDPVTGFTSGELIFTVDETGVNKPIFVGNLQSIILGGRNQISGSNYETIGSTNAITGVGFTNIGSYNSGLSTSGILIGNLNSVDGVQILSFVNNSRLKGNRNIAIGDTVVVSGLSNILVGNDNSLSGSDNVLFGGNNQLLTSYLVGLAQDTNSSGVSGIVLGSYINNTGNNNIYIGNLNNLSGNNNSIVGSYVNLTGTNTVIYGSSDNVSGNSLIVIGSNQSVLNVNSGIFIGNNITSQDSYRSVIVGLGNSIQSGLQDSILVGINNNLSDGNPNSLLLVGQANITKDITGSLVVGNTNNLSGTVSNNLVLGSINAVPSTSNNNLVLGVLNNQTGVYIDSAGSISGTPRRTSGSVNNSIIAGINNIISNGNANVLVGNKNSVSGSNANVLGSYNELQNSSNAYNIGNSNLIVGDKIGTLGSKIFVVGQDSVVFNTSSNKMDVFGSGNIVVGYNAAVSSGIIVGTNNQAHGLNNIVYGKNNTLGLIRHQFTTDSLFTNSITIPSLNVANKYTIGDSVFICIQNPPATNNTFIATIADIVEDGLNTQTTITFENALTIYDTNGYYSVNNTFDDNNSATTSISGIIMPYQQGGGLGGPETNPTYGSNNIMVGSNNNYVFSSGIVVGNNNIVSGVRNVVIGYGISGAANNTLFIGTNNNNKIILDNDKTVFNSGAIQDNFVIKSSSDNTSVVNVDLNNNYFGINTNNPTAPLSVSGLTSTETIRVGFSAPDQYVLTTNVNGYGTWQLPVRISGTDNGLMYRVNNKVASGIDTIQYNPTTSRMGFNLDGNNGFYITSSGLLVNDEGNIYGVRVRGSGGIDFAKTLLETNFSRNRIDFFNVSGNSGNFDNFSVSSGMTLPVSLTGTFLYVNTSGKLSTYDARAYSILFSNGSSWATGNTNYRWIDNQSTLVMGSTGVVSYDSLSTNTNDTRYNILLSSNSSIDTVFNNVGLSNKFSVINSGALNTRRGFHINPVSGQVAINVIPDTYNSVTNQSHLYVEGKTWTQSLKIGNSSVSGLYLRVDGSGNVFSSILDLNTQFSGLFPITAVETSLGQDNAFRVDIGLSDKDRAGNTLGASGDGKFLIYDGSQWNLSNGIKVHQSPWNVGQLKTLDGIEFGHKTKINYTYHTHAFASSSFLESSSLYDGSSQYAQYYLRCRTVGSSAVALTTDWAKNSATTESQYNTISLKNINEYEYDNMWNYKIFVSVIWQDGTSTNDPASGSRSAAGMTIEGCIFRSADGSIFTKLGNESVKVYATGVGAVGLPAGMGIGTYVDNDSQTTIPRLSIKATGVAGKTAVWNATAQINQLNHPGSYNLYGNT